MTFGRFVISHQTSKTQCARRPTLKRISVVLGYSLFEAIGGTYEGFRQKLSCNRHNERVRVVNTTGYRLAKGMWRDVNSSNVIAYGNIIDGSGDDCLDFIHVESDVSNASQSVGSFCSISNNVIKNSQNVQSQGFSQVIISDNILDRMVANAITEVA